jgi:hypothetical protein
MGTKPAEGRVRRGKDDGLRDDAINDGLDDDGIDGEGELKYKMLCSRNRRNLEYAGTKMMTSLMMASMMMLSMMTSIMVSIMVWMMAVVSRYAEDVACLPDLVE